MLQKPSQIKLSRTGKLSLKHIGLPLNIRLSAVPTMGLPEVSTKTAGIVVGTVASAVLFLWPLVTWCALLV